jgi:hypothetical protein
MNVLEIATEAFMRPSETRPRSSLHKRTAGGALLAAAALAAAPGLAAPEKAEAAASLEARLRALEARVAALESRDAAGAATGATAAGAVQCRRLSINGSNIAPGATLTVKVNGATVGVFDGAASGDLEDHMQPGLNIVSLSFAGPGTSGPFGTQAELRCLAPGVASSRNEILRLQPTPGRLAAEARVNLVRP